MLISAPFVSANRAIAENTFVFIATAMPAIRVTRMYTASAIPSPANSEGGNTRLGSRVSSGTSSRAPRTRSR
jgi:hypothetical protein